MEWRGETGFGGDRMTDIGDRTPARLEAADVEVLRYAAFPDGAAGGNPAGVVLNAAALDDAARLAVAAAVGYSETAFLEPGRRDGEFRVRYFSPLAEVAFC